jgi:superfamily I DNA and RNA helicase
MKNSLFYNHIERNEANTKILDIIESYANDNHNEQLYLITAPLGENKYNYDYEKNVIVILSPKHRIIFLNLLNDQSDFNNYYEDFVEDLGSISDKFNYKKHIGRPKEWQNELTITITVGNDFNIENILYNNLIEESLKRKNELIISLLVGSINDIERIGIDKPATLLEKVKNNIILFDGEQTRFIYQELDQPRISIQGLSGTGKTELLLHKLKEIYTSEENSKTFFTCHNIALANTLKERIPNFFNFMKVEKQIQWNKQLWIDRAWGSEKDKNSGLYSYICNFYKIPFSRWSRNVTYTDIFKSALTMINKIEPEDFEYAFDYILIDERQDFPDVFFDLCEKITKKKIYVAGDIFQDIFENNIEERVIDVDFILNKCYRTDPRILMFAHSIGMGLFENKKLNWLKDSEWEASGYQIIRKDSHVNLSREAIRRFEDLEMSNISSMNIDKYININQIIEILRDIKEKNETVVPDDIAIILIDNDKSIFDFMDRLEYEIMSQLKWKVNKAYESKGKIDKTVFLSNRNNVKGLEFPFVICVTSKIKDDYSYRNSLYTMLTRSYIQSFLLVSDDTGLDLQKKGLKIINENNCIQTIEPTQKEKEEINQTIVKLKEESHISYWDFLTEIFNETKIDSEYRKKFEQQISNTIEDKFDRELIVDFIESNRKFYCK